MFSCTLHGEVNMAARNELLLKRKVEVIEYANKNPSQSSRKIVEVFNCGHMQIQISSRKRRRFWVNMKPMRQHLWEQTISHIQLQVHIHHMCAQLNSTSRNCHLHQGNMCFQIGNATDKSMNISRHYQYMQTLTNLHTLPFIPALYRQPGTTGNSMAQTLFADHIGTSRPSAAERAEGPGKLFM